MSKRIFSQEQINELLKNKHVVRCSEKSITYHKDFKLLAITQYQDEGLPARYIFKKAGFDVDVIGRKTPKHCLQSWRKTYTDKGASSFSKEQRGATKGAAVGKRSLKNLSDHEKLKYLEAQVAYLKAENAFLVKLRKKRLN